MRTKIFFIFSLLSLMSLSVYAAVGFKGYQVNVNNVFNALPGSYLAIEGSDAIVPAPQQNASDYCPLPQAPINLGQTKMFQYLGCGQKIKMQSGITPAVIYTLYAVSKNETIRVLSCRLDYIFDGSNCTANPMPLNTTNWAKCGANAKYSPDTGICTVTFRFSPK